MTGSSCSFLMSLLEPIKCEFPPCLCERCQALRPSINNREQDNGCCTCCNCSQKNKEDPCLEIQKDPCFKSDNDSCFLDLYDQDPCYQDPCEPDPCFQDPCDDQDPVNCDNSYGGGSIDCDAYCRSKTRREPTDCDSCEPDAQCCYDDAEPDDCGCNGASQTPNEPLYTLTALFSRFNYNITPDNIFTVLFDIIGTIAFIIMATIIFWLVIAIYIRRSLLILYHAERKCQIIALAILLLLVSCITYHGLGAHHKNHLTPDGYSSPHGHQGKGANKCMSDECLKHIDAHKCPHSGSTASIESLRSCDLSAKTSVHDNDSQKQQTRYCGGKDCSVCSRSELRKGQASHSLCELCEKKFNKFPLTDEEINQIYTRYKWYSIPMEWKSPPAPIVFAASYIRDYFANSDTFETVAS